VKSTWLGSSQPTTPKLTGPEPLKCARFWEASVGLRATRREVRFPRKAISGAKNSRHLPIKVVNDKGRYRQSVPDCADSGFELCRLRPIFIGSGCFSAHTV
jgi:hypothetical protein